MAKQVSIEQLNDFAKKSKVNEVKTLKFGEKDNEIEFELTQYISIDAKRTIVELISARVFIEDELRELNYLDSSLYEILMTFCVMKYYTNIDEMDDLFDMYDAVTSTGLVDFVKDNLPEGELESIEDMIDVRVEEEFRLQEIANSTGYQLDSIMDMLIRKITESLDGMKNFDVDGLNVFGKGEAIEDAKQERELVERAKKKKASKNKTKPKPIKPDKKKTEEVAEEEFEVVEETKKQKVAKESSNKTTGNSED